MELVTEKQVQQFYEDGALKLENVFSWEWVEKVKTGIEVPYMKHLLRVRFIEHFLRRI